MPPLPLIPCRENIKIARHQLHPVYHSAPKAIGQYLKLFLSDNFCRFINSHSKGFVFMKISIITLGCKVNQYESEAMFSQLIAAGFSPALPGKSPILPSSILHRYRFQRSQGTAGTFPCPQGKPAGGYCPDRLYAAGLSGNSRSSGGCGYCPWQPATSASAAAPDAIPESQRTDRRYSPHESGESFEPMNVPRFHDRTRAFLKIEDGCNRFCAYCIIPYARGRVRSKPLDALRRKSKRLQQTGTARLS